MISVFGSNFGQEEIFAASQTLKSQWVGMGKKVKEFEEAFAKHLAIEDSVLVDSGSNALFLAIKLLELPPHSEIILPSFTWIACAQAILMAGHQPVFCDVEPYSQNVTAETIIPHITAKTKAIMVVHYGGKPVDMNPILALGFPVIEDAAHAVDSSYQGKACGTLGDIGIYSFDSIKNLAMGEGGGLVSKNQANLKMARELRYCGIGKSGFQQANTSSKTRWWEYDIKDTFIKMLPTDLEASVGLMQLEKLPINQSIRKTIWDTYQQELEKISWITRPVGAGEQETHSYFTYFIQVPKRDELAHYLLAHNIYTTLRYHPLHLNNIYKSTKKLPVSEHLNEVGLNIPLHPRLQESEVTWIIDKLKKFNI